MCTSVFSACGVVRVGAQARRGACRAVAVLGVCAGFMIGLCGCDGGEEGDRRPVSVQRHEDDYVPPPEVRPRYTFADDLRTEYPEVSAFVQRFLETCLAGDYAGYRRLVSRSVEPASRERFEAVYHALERLTIYEIRAIERRQLPSRAYVVLSRVELQPERKAALRKGVDKIAILVFQELGEWRMMPAPSDLQPARAGRQQSAQREASSESTTTAPAYPWDEFGDY